MIVTLVFSFSYWLISVCLVFPSTVGQDVQSSQCFIANFNREVERRTFHVPILMQMSKTHCSSSDIVVINTLESTYFGVKVGSTGKTTQELSKVWLKSTGLRFFWHTVQHYGQCCMQLGGDTWCKIARNIACNWEDVRWNVVHNIACVGRTHSATLHTILHAIGRDTLSKIARNIGF